MTNNNFNFNHRITLLKENQSKNEFGGIANEFEKIAEIWGKIIPLNSVLDFSKMKEETKNTHIVEVRFSQNYKECKKITFGDREFLITGFYSPNEANQVLVFNVKEIL